MSIIIEHKKGNIDCKIGVIYYLFLSYVEINCQNHFKYRLTEIERISFLPRTKLATRKYNLKLNYSLNVTKVTTLRKTEKLRVNLKNSDLLFHLLKMVLETQTLNGRRRSYFRCEFRITLSTIY